MRTQTREVCAAIFVSFLFHSVMQHSYKNRDEAPIIYCYVVASKQARRKCYSLGSCGSCGYSDEVPNKYSFGMSWDFSQYVLTPVLVFTGAASGFYYYAHVIFWS